MHVTSGTSDTDEEMAVDSCSQEASTTTTELVAKPETCEVGVGASPEEIMSVNMSPQTSGQKDGE
jgi:hypothetical protein